MRQSSYAYSSRSFETHHGCRPRCRLDTDTDHVLPVAGCLSCFVFHFFRAVLFPFLFPVLVDFCLLFFLALVLGADIIQQHDKSC